MKIIECTQGSPEWLQARLGVVTASELDALVTPLWKLRTGEGVKTYLNRKIAERWRNAPLPSYHGGAMEQGAIRQDEAIAWYELTYDETVKPVGFIMADNGLMGCSPDGLIGEGGIEIKCPEPHTHVGYLLGGELPSEYRAQVYGSMYVTGAPWWKFMSYCRGFPPLLVTVDRDEEVMATIGMAVASFGLLMDGAWDKLVKQNGGPPIRSSDAAEEFVFV